MSAADVAVIQAVVVTFAALGLVVFGVLGLGVLAGARPAAAGAIRATMDGNGFVVAGVVAAAASVASLWYSEVAHFPPCQLCWYQRIAMYPLALLLPAAAWRNDRGFRPYGLLLAGAGLAVNLWHVVIETVPSLDPGGCDPTNPCTIRWIEALGFWTIPRMATVCFLSILVALGLDHPPKESPT